MVTFQEAYEEYAQKLYSFLLSLSGNRALAEELLQETFFQAMQHIHQFEGRSSVYTWLCEIGKNLWLKELRRSKRFVETPVEEALLHESSETAEDILLKQEEALRVRQAIRSLQEPYQTVFILHAVSGIRLKEISAFYGKSESWARVTYFRAKTQIIQEVTI